MDYLYALQCIREAAPDFINVIFVFISEYLLAIVFLIPANIYWNVSKSDGSAILLGYCTSYTLNQTIKNIACIYRPWILDSRLYVEPHAAKGATGYSCPSGHTTTAASVYGGVAVYQKKRKGLVVLMGFMILLTAFARNWLGAHTLKDVLIAICTVCIYSCGIILLKKWIAKNPEKDTIVAAAGIVLSIVILVIMCIKKYPMDYDAGGLLKVDPYAMTTDCFTACGTTCGTLLGWWLERHFLRFETEVSKKSKWIRSITGSLIAALLYVAGSKLFSFTGPHFCHLIKYFLIFFFIMYLYPLCFSKFSKKA